MHIRKAYENNRLCMVRIRRSGSKGCSEKGSVFYDTGAQLKARFPIAAVPTDGVYNPCLLPLHQTHIARSVCVYVYEVARDIHMEPIQDHRERVQWVTPLPAAPLMLSTLKRFRVYSLLVVIAGSILHQFTSLLGQQEKPLSLTLTVLKTQTHTHYRHTKQKIWHYTSRSGMHRLRHIQVFYCSFFFYNVQILGWLSFFS